VGQRDRADAGGRTRQPFFEERHRYPEIAPGIRRTLERRIAGWWDLTTTTAMQTPLADVPNRFNEGANTKMWTLRQSFRPARAAQRITGKL
jgi:hypothetical protein